MVVPGDVGRLYQTPSGPELRNRRSAFMRVIARKYLHPWEGTIPCGGLGCLRGPAYPLNGGSLGELKSSMILAGPAKSWPDCSMRRQ